MTKHLAAALVLAVTVVLTFLPLLDNGFVFDDHLYVLDNDRVRSGLTAEGIRWALASLDAANWHPLTWVSHMLDVSLFGGEKGVLPDDDAPHQCSSPSRARNAAMLCAAI